jgi:hypothetical protein
MKVLIVFVAFIACTLANECCVSDTKISAFNRVTSSKDESAAAKPSDEWNGCSRFCNSISCESDPSTCSQFACVKPSACQNGADNSGKPYCGPESNNSDKATYCLKKDKEGKFRCSKSIAQRQTC